MRIVKNNKKKFITLLSVMFPLVFSTSCSVVQTSLSFINVNSASMSTYFGYNSAQVVPFSGNGKEGIIYRIIYPSPHIPGDIDIHFPTYAKFYLGAFTVKANLYDYKKVLNNPEYWEIDNRNHLMYSIDLGEMLELGILNKISVAFNDKTYLEYFSQIYDGVSRFTDRSTVFLKERQGASDVVITPLNNKMPLTKKHFDNGRSGWSSNAQWHDELNKPWGAKKISADPRLKNIGNSNFDEEVHFAFYNFASCFRLLYDATLTTNSLTIAYNPNNEFLIATYWTKFHRKYEREWDTEILATTWSNSGSNRKIREPEVIMPDKITTFS